VREPDCGEGMAQLMKNSTDEEGEKVIEEV
jgi:hypothetical protein